MMLGSRGQMPPMPKRSTEVTTKEYAVSPEPQAAPEVVAETAATERTEHSAPVVTPEAVCFRTAEEVCGACEYMDEMSMCSLLGIPVHSRDSCNAFTAREGEAPNETATMPEAVQ